MSAEARILELIDARVREAVEPLEKAVDELSARLAAVEGAGGQSDAEAPKKPARGRTARAKAQPAEVSSVTGDGAPADYNSETAVDEEGRAPEMIPEQRKGADK